MTNRMPRVTHPLMLNWPESQYESGKANPMVPFLDWFKGNNNSSQRNNVEFIKLLDDPTKCIRKDIEDPTINSQMLENFWKPYHDILNRSNCSNDLKEFVYFTRHMQTARMSNLCCILNSFLSPAKLILDV